MHSANFWFEWWWLTTTEAPAAANALAIASPIPELAPVTTARCWVNKLEDMDFSFLATDQGRSAAAGQQPGILIAPIIPPIMRNMPSTGTSASAPMTARKQRWDGYFCSWDFPFLRYEILSLHAQSIQGGCKKCGPARAMSSQCRPVLRYNRKRNSVNKR